MSVTRGSVQVVTQDRETGTVGKQTISNATTGGARRDHADGLPSVPASEKVLLTRWTRNP